jgi:hypothetical protein
MCTCTHVVYMYHVPRNVYLYLVQYSSGNIKKSNTVVRMVHVLYCRVQYRVPVVELIYLYKYREKYPPVVLYM